MLDNSIGRWLLHSGGAVAPPVSSSAWPVVTPSRITRGVSQSLSGRQTSLAFLYAQAKGRTVLPW